MMQLLAALVLGLLLPPEEAEAASLREGTLLAVEQAGLVAGEPVRAVIRGRAGQWGADAEEAARLATDDEAVALIAPPDGAASHLVLQVAGRTAVPVVSLCADASVSRTGVPWMVRVVPRTIEEAGALFAGIASKPAAGTGGVVAVIPNGRAGREILKDLRRAAAGADRVVEKAIEVESSPSDFGPVCSQVLACRPGLVLIWLDPVPAGALVKALKTGGCAGMLAGPGRLRCAAFQSAAGEAAEGFVVPAIVLGRESASRFHSFETAYQGRFGHAPDSMAAMSYDAAALVIQVLGQEHPPRLRFFPPGFSSPGVSGALSFDDEGNRKVQLELRAARQGRFVPFTCTALK